MNGHPTYVPTGHPVRTFILGSATLGLVAGVLWWSALLNPRLTVTVPASEITGATAKLTISVRNDGPGTVQVERVRYIATGAIDASAPTDDVEIGPGDTAAIPVTIRLSRPECGGPPPVAEIDVRTALGVHRRVRAPVEFDVPAFYDDCSDPGEPRSFN